MKNARQVGTVCMIVLVLFVFALILAAVFFYRGVSIGRPETPSETLLESPELIPDHGYGLFSWHDEVFEPEEQAVLLRLMQEMGLTELYQDIPHSMPVSKIKDLADACAESGIRLYLLVGEPEWALDRKATELRAEIQRAALIGCAGIMVDIEPGSTGEWKRDREPVMESMTEVYIRGKAAAEAEGLEMIACLSWYYDDYGFDAELEQLISNGCDTLAVMNYNREDEIGQIETEAELCRKYGKALISVYELQEVGKYDLEEHHTYREAGLTALWKSWSALRSFYSAQEISAALHEYRAVKQMLTVTQQG